MKSNALTFSLILAALAATVILPFSALAAGTLVVGVGITAIFAGDYGRTLRPVGFQAEVIPFDSAACAPESLARAA